MNNHPHEDTINYHWLGEQLREAVGDMPFSPKWVVRPGVMKTFADVTRIPGEAGERLRSMLYQFEIAVVNEALNNPPLSEMSRADEAKYIEGELLKRLKATGAIVYPQSVIDSVRQTMENRLEVAAETYPELAAKLDAARIARGEAPASTANADKVTAAKSAESGPSAERK